LIISFLYRAFIQPNARSVRQAELVDQLNDYLHRLRESQGSVFPRTAQKYLDEWASGDSAYLRKYYPDLGDEPEYDLTPASEKAIDWLRSLEQKQFVGTESRLLMVIQLLREIAQATENDPEARIGELERRKAEIDREISRLQAGIVQPYNSTQVKERFFQAGETARRLLSDFRQVEENFRQLDRQTREKIATSTSNKGELLDAIFGEQNAIADSDQGRSFRAFWSFLMSPVRQEELQELIRKVLALDDIRTLGDLGSDELLPQLKFQLMEAGEKVQRTSATLVEQLRKYLDDQVWLENKRIISLIHEIEKHAVSVRQAPPKGKSFAELDELSPSFDLPLSRSLFVPPDKPRFEDGAVEIGLADVPPDALFGMKFVDESILKGNIRRTLQQRSQATLSEIVEEYPLEHGLSEVVAYLRLACEDNKATVDLEARQTLVWSGPQGKRSASLPKVIFTR
ncbi:MAG TPA: DUF3375 domain-containing protein, partial [Chroococcales cyanobacterium]|jgi:hypothetical protein